jgi:hypothetical protein
MHPGVAAQPGMVLQSSAGELRQVMSPAHTDDDDPHPPMPTSASTSAGR